MTGLEDSGEGGHEVGHAGRWEQLLDEVSDLVCQLDPAGRITWANRAVTRVTSLASSALVGRSAFDLVHPEDLRPLEDRARSELAKGADSFELRCRLAGGDGTVVSVEWSVHVRRDEGGETEGFDAIGRDVTAFRRSATEARRWRDQLDAVLHAVPFPLFAKDRSGRYLFCNSAFERFFGMRMADMVGRTVWQCWPSEDARVFHDKDIELMSSGATQVYEHEMSDVSGARHSVVFSKACFRDRTGAVGGLVGTLVDVTERQRAQADAREAALLLQAAIEQTATGIVIVDAASRQIVRANRAAAELLHSPELVGRALETGEARPSAEEIASGSLAEVPIGRVLDAGETVTGLDVTVELPGSTVGSLLAGAAPVRDPDGNTVAAIVTLVDVTERRRLMEAVSHAKQEWERTFDAVRELIAVCDSDGRIIRANRAVSDRLAVAPAAIIGGQLDDVLVGPAGEETGLLMQSAAQLGRATEFGVRSPRLGADLQVSVTPRTGTDGGAEGAILVARDVTAERRAERIRQQHLVVRRDEETLRTFRHELGNVLNTLQTTFSAFERHYEELSADKRLVYLQRCRESLDLAGHLHAALARYQKLERIDVAPLDLSGFLGEKATWLFERAEAAGCRCRFEPCSERTTVLADRQAVLRIVLNLIDNAVAAVAHGDEKSITLSCTASSDHGSLTVRDTGCGVPVQLADSVMTPLFTTKPTGSGMGLAIVQRLMDRMGGLVELSSETGRGTTVELRFPRLSERRGAPP